MHGRIMGRVQRNCKKKMRKKSPRGAFVDKDTTKK
jgi:hypothetical protein